MNSDSTWKSGSAIGIRWLQVEEGFLRVGPRDNCQRIERRSAYGPGLASDINNVYEICRVGRDPAPRLWATLYIVFGISYCPSSVNSLQYVWAQITRHPHQDLPNAPSNFPWNLVYVSSEPNQRSSGHPVLTQAIHFIDSLVGVSIDGLPFSDFLYLIFFLKKELFYILNKNIFYKSLFTACSLKKSP